MSVSVLDALRTFKRPLLLVLVLLVGMFVGTLVHAAFFSHNEPVQPIEFSHAIHAGDNAIPCMNCHIYAAKSISSGVPSVNKCMNCHKSMPDVLHRPEIIKLREYWDKQEPIPWVRVHDLPDFVYFPHKRHVQAGVDCSNCHGDVAEMSRIRQVAPLKMQWCLDCHAEKQVANGRDCWTCHK